VHSAGVAQWPQLVQTLHLDLMVVTKALGYKDAAVTPASEDTI